MSKSAAYLPGQLTPTEFSHRGSDRAISPPAMDSPGTGTMPAAEYCPVSIGAQLVGDRWSLLIVRELMVGATRFTEIQRGLPRLSRSLLTSRLRYLERVGIVERFADQEQTSIRFRYRLTPAGRALRPVIEALGAWTVEWRFPAPQDRDLDASLILWRMYQGLDMEACPERELCIEFQFVGAEPARGHIYVDRRVGFSSVCIGATEYDVDIRIGASPRVFCAIWYGHLGFTEAVVRGDLDVDGPPTLSRQISRWFRVSPFAKQVRALQPLPHSS